MTDADAKVEALLARVRERLAGAPPAPEPSAPPPPSGAAIEEDRVAAFGRLLEIASGRLIVVHGAAEAEREIDAVIAGRPAVRVDRDEDGEPDEDTLRAAAVGVDRADVLIAETGTVARTFASPARARVTLIPPTSVFVAAEADLVRDLPAALARLAPLHRAGRAQTVFVTGPSRTADIEKQLVIPAHGPREVVVVLVRTP